jgi:Tfp pilus assembly protein PilZ
LSQERRRLRRHIERIPAQFTSGTLRGQGYLRNLSKQGMFLRCDRLPQPRAEVHIVIEHPQGGKLEVMGRVMWTTAELPDAPQVTPGFGVLIESGTAAYLAFFESLLLG